jgi:hypothetical protein
MSFGVDHVGPWCSDPDPMFDRIKTSKPVHRYTRRFMRSKIPSASSKGYTDRLHKRRAAFPAKTIVTHDHIWKITHKGYKNT